MLNDRHFDLIAESSQEVEFPPSGIFSLARTPFGRNICRGDFSRAESFRC